MTAESAVTPTVIVGLSLISSYCFDSDSIQSLIESAVSRESYCLVPSRSPASALLKRGPG